MLLNDCSKSKPNLDNPAKGHANLPLCPPKYPAGAKIFWLFLYFSCSLGLTIYNKAVMQSLNFRFPCLLSSIHVFSGWIGCYCLTKLGVFVPSTLSPELKRIVVFFSVLYTINIVVSNLSLNLVTVPVHQVIRATTPIITIAFSKLFFQERYPLAVYLSLIPVIVGVPLATFGDYYFSVLGCSMTLLGAVLASVKTIVTNRVQKGKISMQPLDLLYHMSPYAGFQSLLFSIVLGEQSKLALFIQKGKLTQNVSMQFLILALLGNGLIAFLLNFVSFTANGATSPLMMCVSGNVKQVLSIVLAVLIFNLQISPVGVLGIGLTLVGGAFYTFIEFDNKNKGASKDVLGKRQGGMKFSVLAVIFISTLCTGFVCWNYSSFFGWNSDSYKKQDLASYGNKINLNQTSAVSTMKACVEHPVRRITCPSDIPFYGNTKEPIPKIIWSYWGDRGYYPDGTQVNLPQFVSRCVNGWKVFNSDHQVNIVSIQTIGQYIKKTPFPANFTSLPAKIQANWFRLAVLKENGGIWMDASVLLTRSVSFIHEIQQKYSSEGFMYYLDFFTYDKAYPIYETWLIASVPNSQFITSWFEEYNADVVANTLGQPYLDNLEQELGSKLYHDTIQSIQGPSYLNLHVTLQKVMRLQNIPRFFTMAAECGPYYIKNCAGWHNETAIAERLFDEWVGHAPRVIKLIGSERAAAISMLKNNYPISPNSIYQRYLVDFIDDKQETQFS